MLLHHWLGFFGHNGRFSPLLVLRQAATKSAPCRSEFLHIQAAGGEIELSNSDLDKDAGKVSLQRKVLFWRLKPVEAPLSDVSDIKVDTAVDRASGVEVCHTRPSGIPAKPGRCRPRTKKRPRSTRPQSATFWGVGPKANTRPCRRFLLLPGLPQEKRCSSLACRSRVLRSSRLQARLHRLQVWRGFRRLTAHRQHEWVILANLFLLLMGFAILSRHRWR